MGVAPATPIDHAYLARFTLGNAALEREVLDLFAVHAPEYLRQLTSAPSGRAWHEAAHTLKGSARAIGAKEVALEAAKAEGMAWSSNPAERAALAAPLAAVLDTACEYILSLGSDG